MRGGTSAQGGDGGSGGAGGSGGGGQQGGSAVATAPAELLPVAAARLRLSPREYDNTIRDLLGDNSQRAKSFDGEVVDPVTGFTQPAAATQLILMGLIESAEVLKQSGGRLHQGRVGGLQFERVFEMPSGPGKIVVAVLGVFMLILQSVMVFRLVVPPLGCGATY